MRRTAAILLLFAAGGLLAACGKSAHFDGGKHSTRAKAAAGAAGRAGQPLTRARAKTLAAALNLRASDLPGFTVSSERKHESLAEKQREQKLLRCMGAKASREALAEASSKSFERHEQVFHVIVSSSVTIVATPAQAAAGMKTIGGDRARVCLTRFVRQLLAEDAHGEGSAKLVSVTKATPSADGASAAFAWLITAQFTLHEVHIPFYLELVGFAHGQDEVELLSFGLPAPFPASAEQELFSLLAARAKAGGTGGAGKGVKPSKPPSLSGPRRVQISL